MFRKTEENILKRIQETYESISKAQEDLSEALKQGDVRENYSVNVAQTKIQIENGHLIRLQQALGHPIEEAERDDNYGMVYSATGRVERVYEDLGTVRCRNGNALINKAVDYDLVGRELMEKSFLYYFVFLCFPDSTFLFDVGERESGTVIVDYNKYKTILKGKRVGDDFVWSSREREHSSGLLYDIRFTITGIEHVLTKYNYNE